ncbi:MAG: right-handed parallel beta-helix repeat-containing protein [Candidatus Micrarchaeota archaeon]|nr:right-handed parallel beta-helix repeat-containing protein [Candidatus Micrarchaeota archaeon]
MYGSDAQSQEPSNGSGPDMGEQQQPQQGIIPESIITARQNAQAQAPQKGLQKIIIIAGIIIVIAVVAGFSFFGKGGQQTQISSTTTIAQTNFAQISNCGTISSPGRYYLAGNIKTGISSGACINITTNNVALVCNQDKIIGSGPFVGVPPFTYGVKVSGQTNVTISTCPILNFSYGVYSISSSNLSIANDNVSLNYISDIYLNNTRSSKISNNYVSKASGTQGAIFVTNNSVGNRIMNNTVQYNRYNGINVNASYNLYSDNFVNGTPTSFYCSVPNSFPGSSSAAGNICYNSTGCGFLNCRSNNIPANISKLRLSSQISTCGAIIRPGSYSLTSSISMSKYSNTSNQQTLKYNVTCIAVRASNVTLNCMNYAITNASFAISAIGRNNVTINNCRVNNANTAIMVKGSTQVKVANATLQNSTYGLLLNSSNVNFANNLQSYNNKYGIYLRNSSSDTFNRFNSSKNQYGIFVNKSLGEVFNTGTAVNNSATDVYATADSAGNSYSIMQSTTCGVTNAAWATCALHSQVTSQFYPVYACGPLNKAGAYQLNSSIVNASSNCIDIRASNITLNCQGHYIVAAGTSTQGAGFYLNGVSNVTITNCGVTGFGSSFNASNGARITFQNDNASSFHYGFKLSSLTNSVLITGTVTNTWNASIYSNNVMDSQILNNNVSQSNGKNVGYIFINSSNNNIENNKDTTDYAGVSFVGASTNNTVSNNIMYSSQTYDYQCGPGTNGLNSENGGVNYGSNKNGCLWLAVIPNGALVPPLQCQSSFSPNYINLVSDAVYGFGNRCFSIYNGSTTINCQGHTVISNSGGTFAYVLNASQVTIENCALKGFNYPIVAVNAGVSVLNNTISDTNATTTAISIMNSGGQGGTYSSKITLNNVTAVNTGIGILNSTNGALKNNMVNGASTAYKLSNVTSFAITGNRAAKSTAIGLYMTKSTLNQFQNNNFTTSYIGMECLSTSTPSGSNYDQGGNICGSSSSCAWVSSSANTCP